MKIRRNSICSCGSGKKYKLCCGCNKSSKVDIMRSIIDPYDEEDWDEKDIPVSDDNLNYDIENILERIFLFH